MRFTSRYETLDCSDRAIAASAVGPSFGAHVFIRSSARLACYAGPPTCAQAWIGTCDVANSASTYAHAQGGLHHRPDHLCYCPRPLNDFSRTVCRLPKRVWEMASTFVDSDEDATPISSGVCRLWPGSVNSGGTWHALCQPSIFPRLKAGLSYEPAGAFGANVESWNLTAASCRRLQRTD